MKQLRVLLILSVFLTGNLFGQSITLIKDAHEQHSQTALQGDSTSIENTVISLSYSNEQWLDSNFHHFLKITLTQQEYYGDSIHQNPTDSLNDWYGYRWHILGDFWVNNNGCNLYPLKYTYTQYSHTRGSSVDSISRKMHGLFLVDDIKLNTVDSLDITIGVTSGYGDQSQVDVTHFNVRIPINLIKPIFTGHAADSAWYKEWSINNPTWDGNGYNTKAPCR